MFADLYPAPLWGQVHTPLRLGWSQEQLQPIIDILAPYIPETVTPKTLQAVAACARSVVREYIRTQKLTRYSRAKNFYAVNVRYRGGDPLHSWYYTVTAMDLLHNAGLIHHHMGVWMGPNSTHGRQSVVQPTEYLIALLREAIPTITMEKRESAPPKETIILRDAKTKEMIGYTDTPETIRMRAQMDFINQAISETKIYRDGERWCLPYARRVFCGDWTRGGRIYIKGMSHQNIPKEERQRLQIDVDGEIQDTVEIDYASIHMVMAYAEAGVELPPGDLYTIPGWSRTLIKIATNIILNAPDESTALKAVAEMLREREIGHLKGEGKARVRYSQEMIRVIKEKHHPIREAFASGCGIRFQKRDSDIAIRVMIKMIQWTGRAPLPVHDSFMVPESDQGWLALAMQRVALEEGLEIKARGGGREWKFPLAQDHLSKGTLRCKGALSDKASQSTKRPQKGRPGDATGASPHHQREQQEQEQNEKQGTQHHRLEVNPLDQVKHYLRLRGKEPPDPDG